MQPQLPIDVNKQTGIWTTDGLPMLYVPRHFFVNNHTAVEAALGRERYAEILYRAGYDSAYFWCQHEAKTHGLRAGSLAVFRNTICDGCRCEVGGCSPLNRWIIRPARHASRSVTLLSHCSSLALKANCVTCSLVGSVGRWIGLATTRTARTRRRAMSTSVRERATTIASSA